MVRGCLFVGMLGGWALSASSLYVVRSPKGVSVFTKDSLGFTDTYADTRQWKGDDLSSHQELIKRMQATDRGDLIAHISNAGGTEQAEKHAHRKHEPSHHSDMAMDQ